MISILVVEDERIVAEDICRSLESLGYAVTAVVSSGEEAILKAKEENPDLILMDIVLRGEMDGIDAASEIGSQFNIPVVYLTAYADDRRLQRAITTGPYGYILKPFEDRELHTTIEMALYKYNMEKKLKESEQWLATTLRSIGDGVITTDTQGFITFMNPVAEMLTGWTQGEALGRPLSEVFYIINEETRRRCENPFEKIKTGRTVGLANNTVLVARDGRERLIADSGAPICGEDETFLGTVLVFRDVTEKRKMEEDIIRLKTEKMESIGILAGGIAHDFNNILTAVLGNISLAKVCANREDELYRILKEAEKASMRARHLTQQLLQFSRNGAPIRKPASISELLADTAEFALRGSNVRCEFCIPDDLWPVDIDVGQISQVINNIIINAGQAMPQGGVITVCAENVCAGEEGLPLKDTNYVRISIKDEGVGIPEEYMEKIFEPYFTTKQKGSGLGLTTASSIMKNHDGLISVTSQVGKGSQFYMWLPASQKGVQRAAEGETITVVKGKAKILVMDDDESILMVTRDVLNHLGYAVSFARDGSEAVEKYKKARETGNPFDAVLVDLTIRGGWGGEVTIQNLRDIDPYVKAIISSGYSNNPVITNFEKYGFKGAVAKPYSIEELSKVLQDVLHGK